MPAEQGRNVYNFTAMTDDEIYDVVMEHLREYPDLDTGWIDVRVSGGHVTLAGRVGTDTEVQTAASVVGDVLGIQEFTNELVVDELHRTEAPIAADEAVVQNRELDSQLGDPDLNQSDTASHLTEDLDKQTYGTHDVHEALNEGMPYSPPDRPVADGYESRENH